MTDKDQAGEETLEEEETPGKPIIDEPTEPALNPEDDDFDKAAS